MAYTAAKRVLARATSPPRIIPQSVKFKMALQPNLIIKRRKMRLQSRFELRSGGLVNRSALMDRSEEDSYREAHRKKFPLVLKKEEPRPMRAIVGNMNFEWAGSFRFWSMLQRGLGLMYEVSWSLLFAWWSSYISTYNPSWIFNRKQRDKLFTAHGTAQHEQEGEYNIEEGQGPTTIEPSEDGDIAMDGDYAMN